MRLRTGLVGLTGMLLLFGGTSVGGPVHARANATVTTCTPDALDTLDPCTYTYGDSIVSHVQVPVPASTIDKVNDQTAPSIDYIWVDYIRPLVPAGVKVPTIMDASPYFNTLGRGYASILKTPYDPTAPTAPIGVESCTGCPKAPFPEWEAHYFVPRGYAVALMDLRGTRNSTGCEMYGDKQEAADAVSVIDWIASQTWSNGKVGMIGGSYDGTIANGAAALYPSLGTHHNPDALAAIVPIRAIDRWYDYQFFNGVEASGQELDPELFTAELPAEDWPNSGPTAPGGDPNYAADLLQRKSCPAFAQAFTDAGYVSVYQDTRDANTTNFWNSRDFLQSTPTWHAATFFIHGLYDYNVKTMNVGQLWQSLPASVPKRLWFFNGGHADPDTPTVANEHPGYNMPFTFEHQFELEVHRWFLQFLKGVDAGALAQPALQVQRDNGTWDSYAQYPADPSYSNDVLLHLTPANTATPAAATAGSVQWNDEASGATAPASQSFLTAPFSADTRLSGQAQFDITMSATGPDTTIAVQMDDVPPGAENDPNFANDNQATNTHPFAFNFAYIRPFYRASINPRGASYPTGGSPLVPNQHYTMSFPSTYMDYVVHAGHRVRFTFSDASPYSLAAYTGGIITLYTGGSDGLSQVRLPESTLGPSTDVPDLAASLPGMGGPAVGLLVALGAGVIARRRRRHTIPG